MDFPALFAANAFAGNPAHAAAIEWALGPLTIRCDRDTRIAAIPRGEIRLGGKVAPEAPTGLIAPTGADVTLVPRPDLRFSYLAVRGGFEVPVVLGSRSTYLPAGLGGLEGRRLRNGDRLGAVGLPEIPEFPSLGTILSELGGTRGEDLVLSAVPGPQWELFDREAREKFFGSRFVIERASDRSGYRLAGPAVLPSVTASLPSEAAIPGAIQIPDNGQPIVLMPDGPTMGGYPKIAVLGRADLWRLARRQPGVGVRFRQIALEEARAGLRELPFPAVPELELLQPGR